MLAMNTANPSISTCRHCQYYQGEGRRGGYCQQLCAQVQGSWKACYLAIPPFSSDWKILPGIAVWQDVVVQATEHYSDALMADVGQTIDIKTDAKKG